MLGVSLDVLQDKRRFEELIAQGMDALGGEADEPAQNGKKFASSMAA